MSSASGSRSALQRRGPRFPRIPCPQCQRLVVKRVSTTEEHDGWVYYMCLKHGAGCHFWHWELEYLMYLSENGYIEGDEAIDAVAWADERREELLIRKEEQRLTGASSGARRGQVVDRMQLGRMEAEDKKMLDAMAQLVLLLKIIAGLLILLCVGVAVKK